MLKLLLIVAFLAHCVLAANRLQRLEVHTENCQDCGMVFAGTVSFKICGNLDCCYTPWLTGNFDEGNYDYFEGSSQLGECAGFLLRDSAEPDYYAVTAFHQGFDALKMDQMRLIYDDSIDLVCTFDLWLNNNEWIFDTGCA